MIKQDPVYIQYSQFVDSKKLSLSTKRQYLREVRHLNRFYPDATLESLTQAQVSDYLIYRRDELEVRPSTLQGSFVVMRSLYVEMLGRDWSLSLEPASEIGGVLPVADTSENQAPKPRISVGNDRPLGHRIQPDPLTYDHRYRCMHQYAEFLALRYDCPRTRYSYYRQLNLFQRHFDCDPQALGEEHVREYLLFVKFEKRWKPKTIRQSVACLKGFFYELLKQGPWDVFTQIRTKDHDTLPVVLSRQQVHDLIASIRLRRYRTPIKLIYCCGLRLSEPSCRGAKRDRLPQATRRVWWPREGRQINVSR